MGIPDPCQKIPSDSFLNDAALLGQVSKSDYRVYDPEITAGLRTTGSKTFPACFPDRSKTKRIVNHVI